VGEGVRSKSGGMDRNRDRATLEHSQPDGCIALRLEKKLRAKEFSIPIFEWFRYAEI
jgi:hypothetical protein